MRKDGRGRKSCALSPYHLALAAKARARVACMREMRQCGFSDDEIARRFGVKVYRVRELFAKYGVSK